MIQNKTKLTPGFIVRHYNGNVYSIVMVSDGIVHYLGANGKSWAKPEEEFRKSMTIMYNGTNKADKPLNMES